MKTGNELPVSCTKKRTAVTALPFQVKIHSLPIYASSPEGEKWQLEKRP
jgi:hypothetical protein